MMHLDTAVRAGCRIRHRDWPPFHYAQLQPTGGGEWRLCRIAPTGEKSPLDLNADSLDDRNWKILDLIPE